jgi:hypothetical protein
MRSEKPEMLNVEFQLDVTPLLLDRIRKSVILYAEYGMRIVE